MSHVHADNHCVNVTQQVAGTTPQGFKEKGDLSDFELLIYWDLQAHTPSLGLTKRENIQQAAAVGRKMPCRCQWADWLETRERQQPLG